MYNYKTFILNYKLYYDTGQVWLQSNLGPGFPPQINLPLPFPLPVILSPVICIFCKQLN